MSEIAKGVKDKILKELKSVHKKEKKNKRNNKTIFPEKDSMMEASQLLNEAISTESKPIYVLLRGFQYYFITDYEEALKDFHRCLEIDPEFNKAQYYIAKTMFLML